MTEASTTNTANSQARRQAPRATSAPKSRARTGCNQCRIRKIKCDEQRPSCRKCLRVGKPCSYRLPANFGSPPTPSAESSQLAGGSLNDRTRTSGINDPQTGSGLRRATGQPLSEHLTPHLSGTACTDGSSVSYAAESHLNAAQGEFQLSPTHEELFENPGDRHSSTSQLIYLTTVVDYMGVPNSPTAATFTYFLDKFDCPLLSPFEHPNWSRVKYYITDIGLRNSLVADFLKAVQAIYRSQVDHVPNTHALLLQNTAMDNFQLATSQSSIDLEILLICVLLLCLCVVTLPNEDKPCLDLFGASFAQMLEGLLHDASLSAVSLRICAWLQLLNTAAKHPGSTGLLHQTTLGLLYSHVEHVPPLSALDCDTHPERGLYDALAEPLFNFYLTLQKLSNQVCDVTHYRRLRSTTPDQEEVSNILADLKTTLATLWETRPSPLRLEPAKIREHLSASIAAPLISMTGLCIAAFYVETIVIGRILGDPPLPTSEAEAALQEIRQVVDGDWQAVSLDTGGAVLNPGYLRPLFVYALESFQKEQSDWAAYRLRQIKHPNSTANFLASFVEAHGEAQRSRCRRVTMKYFCYHTFGVPLPFM